MRVLRYASAALLVGFALASASACQVALRAEDEDPACTPNGKLCAPGRICRGGRCSECVPKPEECNFEDDDCDGEIDEDFDQDKDGFTVCGEFGKTDCNDDPSKGGADIHPGQPEACNGIDDNCDGKIDEEPNGCADGKTCLAGKAQCVDKDDCRFFGCPPSLGCNVTTGKCTDPDCRANPTVCKAGEKCDPDLGRCVKVIVIGDGCDALAACDGAPGVECFDLTALGISARSNAICTKACCESATCPDGFVCKMGTSGNSVCVRASDIGLVLGGGASFAKCVKPDDCRSGVCTSGTCLDGCCGAPECGTGGTCSLRSDNRFFCRGPVGSKVVGDSCDRNSDCSTGYCVGVTTWTSGRCTKHCCTSSDCPGNWKCQEFTAGAAVVPMCEPLPLFGGSTGSLRGGAKCGGNSECRSNLCEDGACSDFCCRDSDCTPGSFCRARASGTRVTMKCTKAP